LNFHSFKSSSFHLDFTTFIQARISINNAAPNIATSMKLITVPHTNFAKSIFHKKVVFVEVNQPISEVRFQVAQSNIKFHCSSNFHLVVALNSSSGIFKKSSQVRA
jgi:hypothetical protein